ncbi:tyrosine-type recombinase/integrase [Georgenia yuyongxinii]
MEDPWDAYERFFLRRYADLVQELLATVADLPPDVSNDRYSPRKPESRKARKAEGFVPIVDYDPFDLTGAARMRVELLADGATAEEADRLALLAAHRYAENTVRNLTDRLGTYLQWCEDNHLVPVPATRTTILRFFHHLFTRGRVWDGKPLSPGTVAIARTAIGRAHTVLGHANPFDVHPGLADVLLGYSRLNGRPQVQAHAILLDDLAALLAATRSDAMVTLRDNVILTVVTDPEAGMNVSQATRWCWEHTTLADPLKPAQATRAQIAYAQKPGFEEIEIPNRIASVNTSGREFPPGEMPLAARLCGTASLRAMATNRVARDLPLSGPVLTKHDGSPLTAMAIRKVIQKAAKKAGLPYRTNYSFDDRAALLAAAEEPSLIALRDAAIMAIAWWASLRRSEVSGLSVGDIGADSRGRGLIILVRRSKTDAQGQYVAVPHARNADGRPWATDLQTALHAWLDAYARHIGRALTGGDPLFINSRGEPERLGEESVGTVIKRWAHAAGIQAELGERISSHGFRAGYATEWLRRNKPAEPLARRQRRKSTESVLTYFRLADPFEDSLTFLMEAPDGAFQDLSALIAKNRRARGL